MLLEKPFSATVKQLELFLDISGDRQSIHDPKLEDKAILPANFILTLIPACVQKIIHVETKTKVMTVGYQSIMFRHPVHLNEPLSVSCSIKKVVVRQQRVFVFSDIEITSELTNVLAVTLRVTDCYDNGL